MEGKENVQKFSNINVIRTKRMSLISIILLVVIVILCICVVVKIAVNKNKIDVSQKVFSLSDKSKLIFLDDENYALIYDVNGQNISMYGKYKLTYGNNISSDVRKKYEKYIEKFSGEKYELGYLELQNEELYINNVKTEKGNISINYILMAYYEDDTLKFTGYNVGTGVKVKYVEQKGEFSKYYNELKKGE